MRAGQLNRRITIQAHQSVDDPVYGPQPAGWVDMVTVWAEVQDALPSKSESLKDGLVVAYNRTRVRIRYRSGITADMRIVELGGLQRTLQIVGGPAILGNKVGIEMLCEEYSS